MLRGIETCKLCVGCEAIPWIEVTHLWTNLVDGFAEKRFLAAVDGILTSLYTR
jgi:hypothetical protein